MVKDKAKVDNRAYLVAPANALALSLTNTNLKPNQRR